MGRDVLVMLDGFQSGLPDRSWAGLERQMSDRLDRLSESDFFEMKHKKEAEHGVT